MFLNKYKYIGMKTRGEGLHAEVFFSICSKHQMHDENCPLCNKGSWQNIFKYEIGSLFYNIFPNIWRWKTNRNFKLFK